MDDIISSSLQKAFALQHALKELLGKDYPVESSRLLAERLLQVSERIVDRLLGLASEEKRHPGQTQREEVLVLGRAIAELAALAEPVARSRTESVPWGIALPVEMLCQQISPGSRVIIHPRWDYNYGYYEVMRHLRKIGEALSGWTPESMGYPTHFAVLSFPESERLNILQNAAWGHEIGHHMNEVFSISESALKHPILDPGDVDAAVEQVLAGPAGRNALSPEGREQLRARILETLFHAVLQWVRELIADMLAIRIFGPAALFAFADIVPIIHPMDSSGPDYPPARLRMEVMLEEVQQLGFVDLVAEPSPPGLEADTKAAIRAEIAQIEQICQQRPATEPPPEYLPALKAIRAAIPVIRQEVEKVCDETWACSKESLRQEVFQLVERLAHDVPPCEVEDSGALVGRPASLAAIVNAGWFYRILKSRELPTLDEGTALRWHHDLAKLNELILKAIELSDVRKRLLPRRGSDEKGND